MNSYTLTREEAQLYDSDDAAEIVIRANRKMGELLKDMRERGERRKSGVTDQVFPTETPGPPSLADIGVSRLEAGPIRGE